MELLDYVALSKSRYTDQFDDDLVFDAIVQTLIEYKMKVQGSYLDFAKQVLDIDLSKGKNLDLIGSIVGQSRILVDYFARPYFGFQGNPRAEPLDKGLWYSLFSDSGGDSRTLNDEEYRRVIKARIIRNKTNCTRKDMIAILNLLIGKDNFQIKYKGHGNIVLNISGVATDMATYFLSRVDEVDSLIPKPLGYRLMVETGNLIPPTFEVTTVGVAYNRCSVPLVKPVVLKLGEVFTVRGVMSFEHPDSLPSNEGLRWYLGGVPPFLRTYQQGKNIVFEAQLTVGTAHAGNTITHLNLFFVPDGKAKPETKSTVHSVELYQGQAPK